MNPLALLALLFLATRSRTSDSDKLKAAPRRKVTGKSGNVWFVAASKQSFGVDKTDVQLFSVFASETGNDLVIAYATFSEAMVKAGNVALFGDDGRTKVSDVRALFYASPSTLTKTAVSDFI